MAGTPPDRDALAQALLAAEHTVVLTGLQLGAREDQTIVHVRDERARHTDLETLLTDPKRFWAAWFPMASELAERTPGPAHVALVELERAGAVSTLITQSVDRLHVRAGSHDVIEVYGNALSTMCERCGERYALPETGALIEDAPDGVPRCTTPECTYPLRPSGTLWGEPLPSAAIERAWRHAARSDLFLVLDSDLRTAPISLLPSVPLTRGTPLIVVGEVATQYDRYAQEVIREPSTEVMGEVAAIVARARGGEAR